MSRCDKLLAKARAAPASVTFTEVCQLAECHGFRFSRQSGSHRMYKRQGFPRLMNFQDHNGRAKGYRVRQLLEAIDEIGDDDDTDDGEGGDDAGV